jgi:hypothetical protein
MADSTPILALPLILASQAQKHVTHNEALRLLDIVVQLSVLDWTLATPPVSPIEGDRYIVAPGATGVWAGHDGQIAAWWAGDWAFVAPLQGWSAWVEAGTKAVTFIGSAWSDGSDLEARFARLGVNAAPDATNRLAVSSPAVLFNHAGAGSQVKLNKALATDTASLLLQTGFSGRAEIGLAGSDNLSVKVSSNGSTFTTALGINNATGEVSLPQGAVIDGLVNGTAVTQNALDTTAGRLTRVGDFGWGGIAPQAPANIDTVTASGVYSYSTTFSANGPSAVANGTLLHLTRASGVYAQIMIGDWTSTVTGHIWSRARVAGAWSAWFRQIDSGNLLGSVSQSGGAPTGAVIERGSNANGEYVRFADGTQICTRTTLSAANASTATGSLFRSSASVTWTFPAAFAAAPAVSGNTDDADSWLVTAAAPTTTASDLRAMAAVSKASALTLRATAVGRWF